MSEIECEICGRSPKNGETVFRSGEKGAGKNPGWRCRAHLTTAVDPEVNELVSILENRHVEDSDVSGSER